MNDSMDPLIVTQPDNGGPYVLNRPMTRGEMLDLLARSQNGEASCLYTLKTFEAHYDLKHNLMINALALIRDGDKMDYRVWAKSVARAGLNGEKWLSDFPIERVTFND